MKAQTWWKGSKTFRIRNERSWFYYFVIFLFIKKKKQFHHNFASQPSFNSSFPFRLKIILNVEKNSFQAINGIIFNLALTFLYQTISCHNHPSHQFFPPFFIKIWTNKILNRKANDPLSHVSSNVNHLNEISTFRYPSSIASNFPPEIKPTSLVQPRIESSIFSNLSLTPFVLIKHGNPRRGCNMAVYNSFLIAYTRRREWNSV